MIKVNSEIFKIQDQKDDLKSERKKIATSNEIVLNSLIPNYRKKRKTLQINTKILPESVLFTMIKFILDHVNQINITNSILSINSEDLDLAQKLSYYMEVLAHIPFSFQYSNQQTKIILDFFHLEKEIQLLTNMEI